MFIALTKPSASPAKHTVRGAEQPRFGGPTTDIAKQSADIAYIGIAKNWIQPAFKWAKSDIRIGGLSLEDMAGRLLTLVGIYIPQGYFAYRDNKHPWETNGRNAVVWLMTLGLTSLTKSENYGVNTLLLNPIMQQKGSAVWNTHILRPFVDPLRMEVDYVDILKDAKISLSDAEKEGAAKGKKALWASSWLDTNKIEKIQNRLVELNAKAATEKLTDAEQAIQHSIPKLFRRINLFNGVSTGIITAATVYFIGGVAMKIVNKVFTPLDKNQDDQKPSKQPGIIYPPSTMVQPGMPYPPLYGYNRRLAQPAIYRGRQ